MSYAELVELVIQLLGQFTAPISDDERHSLCVVVEGELRSGEVEHELDEILTDLDKLVHYSEEELDDI